MVLQIAIGVVASLLYLFMFWRQLKDDYVSNQIFTTAFLSLASSGLLGYVAYRFIPAWWFWISSLGVCMSIVINSRRFRMRAIEVLEAGVVGFLPVLSAVYLVDFSVSRDKMSLFASLASFVFIVLFYAFNSTYKSFTWYKSGKVGFAGLATLGIIFLVRAIVAMQIPNMLSFVGGLDLYLSIGVSISAFIALFYLARQT